MLKKGYTFSRKGMAIPSEVRTRSVLFTLVVLMLLDQCSCLQEDVFVLENKDHPERKTIVIVTRAYKESVDCVTLTKKMLVEDIVSFPADHVVIKLSEKNIRNALRECTILSKRRKRRESKENDKLSCSGGDCDGEENCKDCDDGDCDGKDDCDDQNEETLEEAEELWKIIFPGTKWCGIGDIAKDDDDLGILRKTDKCCRSHDQCNDTILAGETKHNITNNSKFTLLSCACDDAFYDCLSKVNSVISNTVGRVFFNIVRQSCFTKDYPLTNTCKSYRSFLKISCKEYEKNTTVSKVYVQRPSKRYK